MRRLRGFLRRRVFLLLLIAGLIRIGFVVSLDSDRFIPGPDQLLHDSLARNLVSGRGLCISEDILYPPEDQPEWVKRKMALFRQLGGLWGLIRPGVPQVTIPPVNPLVLALCYWLFGVGNLLGYRLVMALISTVTCWLVFDTTRRIFGRNVGLLTLAVMAVYPALIYFCGIVLTETLFVFLLALLVEVIIKFRERPRTLLALVAGAIWVVGLLTKSVMSALLPWALLLILFPRRGRVALIPAAAFLVAVGVCLAPWVVRNYGIFGRLVILPTKSWNIWERNNYRFNERFWREEAREARAYEWLLGRPPFKVAKPQTTKFPSFSPQQDEVERNEEYVKLAREFILANPWLYAKLCLARGIEFFRILGRGRRSLLVDAARTLSYGIVLPLFVFGFILCLGKTPDVSRHKLVVILLIALYVSLHILTTAEPRYRLPIEPYMIAFASYGAFAIVYRRLRRGRSGPGGGTGKISSETKATLGGSPSVSVRIVSVGL